jgi:prepilin-type N-terminal cleavage/methylation domain-containing protein
MVAGAQEMSRRKHEDVPESNEARAEVHAPASEHAQKRMAREAGFTLIELILVISILGLMATIASPSFFSMRDRARYAGCVLKQRQIHEVAILYGAENDPGTVKVRVMTLTAGEYITPAAAECPSSRIENFDDYEISFRGSAVDALVCDVMGADHLYTP